MDTFLSYFIARSIPTLLGAFEIDLAVHSFKEKRYFLFGLLLMMACSNLILVAKIIMKG